MAEITNVINTQLLAEGQLAQYDNINVVGLITSERGLVLSSVNRYKVYKTAAAVARDFGASSQTTDFANAFFGTSPNPISAGGALVIGYWRAGEESVEAKKAVLTGIELSEATVLSPLQIIKDGSFKITIDSKEQQVTGLDFGSATSLEKVVAVLDRAITGASVSLSDLNQVVITSETTGASSKITALTAHDSGTFIGSILGVNENGGAFVAPGADAITLAAETKLEAITAIKKQVNIFGACFIDSTTSQEALELASWSKANNVIMYDVFGSSLNLLADPSNAVWQIKLSSLDTYRCLFSKAGNRKFAVSYMARAHVVNFAGENTAMTMHLKTLSIPAEEYSEDELTKAKTVGLDVYTTIKNVSVVLTSGANNYVDNVYNIMSYIDAVQTDMFNLLKGSATKIPQTARGINQMIDQAEKTSRRYVRAGFIGAGTWSSTDYFGNLDVFNRAIERDGFYWLAGELSEQSQADRQARKSPVLQNAIKNAGAIHSADIIINFNY